jgi:hypothetical protein
MDKSQIEELTNQQLAAAYGDRPPSASDAAAAHWSQLFEYLRDHHSVAFAERDRTMVENNDRMMRFYDLLMDDLQKDARHRGVCLGDKDISLLGVVDETDFERLGKRARH